MEFHSKNKFEKLVHLVCFIVRIGRSKYVWQMCNCARGGGGGGKSFVTRMNKEIIGLQSNYRK